ncbi:hypothetical protein [Streptococcus dysgalactiae]|uniref:hypothetical protein n=1 Tax=Streptococcus dysgalactiae TaxID=1334 RepID=UPI003FD79B22
MKIRNSKTLLFTSLVAVALLGATQPVSAETYTSSNFDWSEDGWSEDGWSEDGWSEDGWSEDDWSKYGLSKYGWSEDGWSSDKKDETEDGTRPPYGYGGELTPPLSPLQPLTPLPALPPVPSLTPLAPLPDYLWNNEDKTEDGTRPPYGYGGELTPPLSPLQPLTPLPALPPVPSLTPLAPLPDYLWNNEDETEDGTRLPHGGISGTDQDESRIPEINIPSPGENTIPEPPRVTFPEWNGFNQNQDWGGAFPK